MLYQAPSLPRVFRIIRVAVVALGFTCLFTESSKVAIKDSGTFYSGWTTNAGSSSPKANVSNRNTYMLPFAGHITGRVTVPDNNFNGLIVTCAGPITRTATADGGSYRCASLPVPGEYTVTPSKAGVIFSPPSMTVQLVFEDLNVVLQPFVGSLPLTISGRVMHPNGITGVNGVSVALTGSQVASRVTDADGNYSFTSVLSGGNYTITPSSPNIAFSPTSTNFNNLSGNQIANFTATFSLELMLDESGQVAALDSMLLTRDPLPVINTANVLNRGVDRNTRVVIFVSNFLLGHTEPPSLVVINLVGSNGQSYDIPAEDVRAASNPAFAQVIFRLPDTLTPGTCTLLVKAQGLSSNVGALRIKA